VSDGGDRAEAVEPGRPVTSVATGGADASGGLATPAKPVAYPQAARGYAETAGASLMNGSVGVLVSSTAMPTGMLVVARMAFAALFLSPLVLRRERLKELRPRGVLLRLTGMGLLLTGDILLYFVAIRYAGVAAAIFLVYTAPVYVAAAAPRVLKEPADRITHVTLAIALAGMATIVAPGLAGSAGDVTPVGVLAGAGAGVCYAVNLLALKRMRTTIPAASLVWFESLVMVVVLLPLGIYEVVSQSYVPTATDVLMGALLGLIPLAIGFTLFVHGLQYIKVQHGAIIGYLEPVSAPLYALLILGQVPSVFTLIGGALIVLAGVLLIVKGRNAQVLV
jgi:drug/metabolite transporter (DMT)-like permease